MRVVVTVRGLGHLAHDQGRAVELGSDAVVGYRHLAEGEGKGTAAARNPAQVGGLGFPSASRVGQVVVLDERNGDRRQRTVARLVEPLDAGVVGESHVAGVDDVGAIPGAFASTGAMKIGIYEAVSFDGRGGATLTHITHITHMHTHKHVHGCIRQTW